MHRYKYRFAVGALALALAAPFIGVGPASAAPAPAGCKSSSVTGAVIGQYPAQPASQSTLRVACTFPHDTTTDMASAKFTIHDFDNALWHNGAARTINPTANVALGATTFTAANFAGITAYVNRSIAGPGIAPRTFVKSISGAGLVTLSDPTTAAMTSATLLKIDNAIARSRADVSTTNGSTTITSLTANFTTADVGLSVSGTDIPDNTTIASFTSASQVVLSNAATATAAGSIVTFGGTLMVTSTRQANDATWTATVITSAASKFKASDIGLPVYSVPTGAIPANTFITAVAGNTATTSVAMTPQATAAKLVIGDPSATAPTNVDQVALQGVQLDLNPALVPGSGSCAGENAEGFATVARWNNPGSFGGSVAFNTQPAGTKALGQIIFDTSVTDFSAFVVEKANLSVAGQFLYDIVFPNVPTLSALCPATATSPGLGFSISLQASTLSQAQLKQGVGRPATAQLRSLLPSATGGYTFSASIQSDDPLITFLPTTEFTRLCSYPTGPAQVNFKCGN